MDRIAPTNVAVATKWLDLLERELAAKAETVGLLGHGTLIGDGREFIVTEVLSRFLPSAVSVGRGVVIDSVGGRSNQCDIVISDNRYPIFRHAGGSAMFPVESVVATIEVKSRLNRDRLHEALDNGFSVMKLHPTVDDSPAASVENVSRDLMPKNYVFGFEGYNSHLELASAVRDWLRLNKSQSARADLLPAVVVAGGCVGCETHDVGRFNSKLIGTTMRLADGTSMTLKKANWIAAPTVTRFGWLAVHLLTIIARRLHATVGESALRPVLTTYLPFTQYWTHAVREYVVIGDGEKTVYEVGSSVPVTDGTSVNTSNEEPRI